LTIPPAFLDEIRARIALSDIVGRRLRLQRAGREWKAPCPFHQEKTPSFYINDQKSFFHCFGCGAHGDAVGFLMRHDGLAFPEAVEQLAGLAGLEMPRPEPEERKKFDRHKLLADALEAAAKWFEAQLMEGAGREALAYLKGRGLDDRTIAEFRLGYAPAGSDALRLVLTGQGHDESVLEEVGLLRRPDDGRAPYAFFRNRVMFPVADKRGRVIAFGGRVMEGDGPKYVNSPEHALFHKGSVLYGMARARAAIAKGEVPIVVEGYMDVISLQSAGLGGAVAPLGTALGEAQLVELWKAQDEKGQRETPPILFFDGDNAGRRAAERAVDRVLPFLAPSRSVSVAFLPQGEDPDSLVRAGGSAAARRVLEGSLSLIDAVWRFSVEDRALATPEQRAGLWAELDGRIRTIADTQVQSLYRVELRRRFDALFLRRGPYVPRDRRMPFVKIGPKPGQVRPASALEARIILALVINHPFLFDEVSENFAEIALPRPWEPLRGAVFEALTAEALDAEALGRHLRSAGYGLMLDDVLGPETTRHARFVKPETPGEEVRAYWLDISGRIDRRRLERELVLARSDPDKCDDRAMERIRRLGERVYYGEAASEDMERTPVGVDHDGLLARVIAEALKAPAKDRRHDDVYPGDGEL
jgi:DNA primase